MPNPDRFRHRRPSREQLLMACDNDRLGLALLRWCRDHWKDMYMAEPGSADVVGIACFATVVDRGYMGLGQWVVYCNYCAEVAKPISETQRKELEALPGGPPVEREDTPVIIVDSLGRGEATEQTRIPPSKEDLIHFIPRSNVKQILHTLDNVLDRRYT